MRLALLLALLALIAGAAMASAFDGQVSGWTAPPARYRADTLIALATASPAATARYCQGWTHAGDAVACEWAGVAHLPNPCGYPASDRYAALLCHEIGHAQGWPASHPQ